MRAIYHQPLFALTLVVLLAAGCASSSGPNETISTATEMDTLSDAAETDFDDDSSSVAVPIVDELNGVATPGEAQNIAALDAAVAQANSRQSSSDLFPPNAKPGHCYARVLTPAKFETTEEEVPKQEASHRIEIIPAEFEWVEEEVVLQEATTTLEVVPAKYETITEQVLVKPESKKIVEIPAEYRTEDQQVLDKPAHTIWKRSSGPADSALQTKLDKGTGEVVCLVEVPASYKTVKKTVLATPARTEKIIVPAEYEAVTKTVETAPATTREVYIPAKTAMLKQQRLVKPAREQKIEIPATYETVVKRTKISEDSLVWQEVLCRENMSSDVISDIQRKLNHEGFNSGKVDGQFGTMTLRAVNAYAKAKDLPLGKNYIAIETVDSLGLNY